MTDPMASKQEIKLAENLKRLMAAKNLTVTTAARKIGMNKSTLHNYYNGVIPRNLQMLRELADLLDVPLAELLYGKGTNLVSLSAEVGIEGRYEITIRRVDDWNRNGKR